jgi:hypothetical protein
LFFWFHYGDEFQSGNLISKVRGPSSVQPHSVCLFFVECFRGDWAIEYPFAWSKRLSEGASNSRFCRIAQVGWRATILLVSEPAARPMQSLFHLGEGWDIDIYAIGVL